MKKIYAELARIQSELKAPKNLYNSFGKYSYRNAEGILESVKPLLGDFSLGDDAKIAAPLFGHFVGVAVGFQPCFHTPLEVVAALRYAGYGFHLLPRIDAAIKRLVAGRNAFRHCITLPQRFVGVL